MRFSIVFDDNGTILDASVDGEQKDTQMPGTGVSKGYVDISDDLPDVELNHTVERMLIELDAKKLEQSPDRGEADDSEIE
jgi:hypothetical protein